MEDANGRKLGVDYRVNVVSALNFLALIGILATALSTWFSLIGEVKSAQSDIAEIKVQLSQSLTDRRTELESLRTKDEIIVDTIRKVQDATNEKLYSIDTRVQILQNTVGRVESTVKEIKKESLE